MRRRSRSTRRPTAGPTAAARRSRSPPRAATSATSARSTPGRSRSALAEDLQQPARWRRTPSRSGSTRPRRRPSRRVTTLQVVGRRARPARDARSLLGPPSPSDSRTASFAFDSDEADATFECSLDGAPYAPCPVPSDFTDLANGEHTLLVRAVDAFGNVDATPASYTWTVDADTDAAGDADPRTARTPPRRSSTRASASPPSRAPRSSARSTSAPFAACTSPVEYTDLALGDHVFRVRATDARGNVEAPVSHAWTIEPDTTPPETTLHAKPPATTLGHDRHLQLLLERAGRRVRVRARPGAVRGLREPDGLHRPDARRAHLPGARDRPRRDTERRSDAGGLRVDGRGAAGHHGARDADPVQAGRRDGERRRELHPRRRGRRDLRVRARRRAVRRVRVARRVHRPRARRAHLPRRSRPTSPATSTRRPPPTRGRSWRRRRRRSTRPRPPRARSRAPPSPSRPTRPA